MKKMIQILCMGIAMLLLAACSHASTPVSTANLPSAQASVPPAPVSSSAAVADSASPEPLTSVLPAVTPLPIPLPTQDLTPNLPDPGQWASSLHIDAKDYPRVDGSTATIPLGIYLRAKITGETLAQSSDLTQFSKTGQAWEALAGGEADLLIVYEAPDEVKQKIDMAKLTAKPAGLDALVFLTNSGNPVTNLTRKQIVGIYSGKIKKWSQVGGQDINIVPYQRISNSGSQALMVKLVMKSSDMMDAPSSLRPGEMEGLVDGVVSYANTANAIGYSVYYYAQNMYRVPGIQLLAVDGVAPTSDTIASGAYPYVNPFYAVIRADEPAGSPAHKLFDWLTGAEGKRAIKDAGYVPAN